MKLDFQQILKKVEELKRSGTYDLSLEEDLSIAVMNLVSLEEHFFFTAEKTKKVSYLDLVSQVREVRKQLLEKLMPKNEGETWCISKHLLGASMRLMEVATKLQSQQKLDEAKNMFDSAYKIYSLFWAVRFQLIDTKNVSAKPDITSVGQKSETTSKNAWSYEDLVTKLVDCCKE